MAKFRCTHIDYDTFNEQTKKKEEVPGLPAELIIEIENPNDLDMLADEISVRTGYCINGFYYEEIR